MQARVSSVRRMSNVTKGQVEATDMEWIAAYHDMLYRLQNRFDDSFGPFVWDIMEDIAIGWTAFGIRG